MTVFNVGDRVVSIEQRDSMPPGAVGIVMNVGLLPEDEDTGFEDDEILVDVEPHGEYDHHMQWYFFPHQLILETPLEIIGDNDDDCI